MRFLTIIGDCAISSVIRIRVSVWVELMVVGGAILVQIDGAASIIVGEFSGIVNGKGVGNLAFLAGFSLFLLLGLNGEGEVAERVCVVVESAGGERISQRRIRVCKGGRNNGGGRDNSLVGLTILVQVNRVPQQIRGELISGNDGDLTLLAILLGLSGDDVRGGVVIRVCAKGIWSGKRSDAISQWSDDLLGDFLLLEEGGGGRGFLSSVGLENGRLDGVLNSGRGAVNNGMSVVCEGVDSSIGEGNLGSGASQKESKDKGLHD